MNPALNMKLPQAIFAVFAFVISAHSFSQNVDSLEHIPVIKLSGVIADVKRVITGIGASPHVVGGVPAVKHGHPYQVAVKVKEAKGGEFTCGGALISPKWVLTAAHCTKQVKSIHAYAGVHNLTDNEPTKQIKEVVEIITRPDWDKSKSFNDVALLRLKSSFDLNKQVQPIRLPSLSQKNASLVSKKVIMIGWGKLGDRKRLSPVLQYAESKVMENSFCKEYFAAESVKDFHICVDGTEGKRVCDGDSGSPLVMIESDGQHTVVGVASFGAGGGCDLPFPTVFSRVAYYLEWIYNTTSIPIRQ